MARRQLHNQKASLNRNFKGFMLLGGIAISLAMVAFMTESNRSPIRNSLNAIQQGRRLDHNSAVVCLNYTKVGYIPELFDCDQKKKWCYYIVHHRCTLYVCWFINCL